MARPSKCLTAIRIDKLPFLAAIAYNAHNRKAGRTGETAVDPSVNETKLIDLAQTFKRAETVFGYTEYRVLADLISGRLESRPETLQKLFYAADCSEWPLPPPSTAPGSAPV